MVIKKISRRIVIRMLKSSENVEQNMKEGKKFNIENQSRVLNN